MSSNYPPGAARDPKAPYNETKIWEPVSCVHCGRDRALNSEELCEDCFYENDDNEDEGDDGV